MNMQSPVPEEMITVLMVTYNHEAYIAKAIDGVMLQKTSFPFQLIIGDDASTDKTAEIVHEFLSKYPGKIVYVRNEMNMGMLPNFANIFSKSASKYIAICDGDDYWTDLHKLQKQVDFLEANPEYSICFHRVYEQKKELLSTSNLTSSETEGTFTAKDLGAKNIIHTCSVIIRKNALPDDYPNAGYMQLPVGDYPLFMLAAKNGKIKYLPDMMAVYRRHEGGVWSNIHAVARFEKWLSVLMHLLQEDFTADVKEGLRMQEQHCKEEILKRLMNEANWQIFMEKLEAYSANDEYVSRKWLLEYYPAYIASYTSSRTYRLTKPFRFFLHKLKKKMH